MTEIDAGLAGPEGPTGPESSGAAAESVDARLDRLSAQMDWIVEQMQAQQASREKWVELSDTMVPVTRGAMDMLTRELDDLSDDVTVEDAAQLARTLARSIPQMQALVAQLDSLTELAQTLSSLSGPAFARLTEVLEAADDKGYFAFARQGAEIVDKVVTEFTEDDVAALGDNVVTILNTVKEMTQPEVMGMLQRTALTMQAEETSHEEPPSLFALLKSMRDPQTRRGLSRVVAMLHTVGDDETPIP